MVGSDFQIEHFISNLTLLFQHDMAVIWKCSCLLLVENFEFDMYDRFAQQILLSKLFDLS